jgi:hypothetical protein
MPVNMRLLKLTILGLAGYGGYTLWKQYGTRVTGLVYGNDFPADRRVDGRSELTVTEVALGSDDPVAQASAILADSDTRTDLPRDTPGVEHRRSEDTVEP